MPDARGNKTPHPYNIHKQRRGGPVYIIILGNGRKRFRAIYGATGVVSSCASAYSGPTNYLNFASLILPSVIYTLVPSVFYACCIM